MASAKTHALLAGLCAGVLAVGAYEWWSRQARAPLPAVESAPPVTAAPAPPPADAAPTVLHPVPPQAAASAVQARLEDAVVALLGQRAALGLLQLDDLPRRLVATVDNLGRAHAAPALWPVNPTAQRFSVDSQRNAQRYAAFVQLIEAVDAARAVELYFAFYPQFQQAYEELGYPKRYFNDRLVAVIDLLLATPEPAEPPALRLVEVQGPVKPARPWVHYEFADPALQSLASGQKLLLRMGLANERRVKARLRELRRQLVREGALPAR